MTTTKIDEATFREVCNESLTMAEAAAKLKLHFTTFKAYAKKWNLYRPNQGSKGSKKPWQSSVSVHEIIEGKHPSFQTFKLKNKLLAEGLVENKCQVCGLTEWQGKQLNCELDHIDGDRTNHLLSNLRMLCPNCHAQTSTYRSKNRTKSVL